MAKKTVKEFRCKKCGYTFHLKKNEEKPVRSCTMCGGQEFQEVTALPIEQTPFGYKMYDGKTGEYLNEGDYVK